MMNLPDVALLNALRPDDTDDHVPARGRRSIVTLSTAGLTAAILAAVGFTLVPQTASAIPSFARQTGQPCAACHTIYPQLTPFGRQFKLNGYTLSVGKQTLPPLAFMVQQTFAHTQKDLDGPPAPGWSTNNNFDTEQASIFFGGKIYGNLGAFVQTTYDGEANAVALDLTDIRYADTAKLFGEDAVWGITVNNTPSVEDVWNTTPAWQFPFIGPPDGIPAFGPPGTMLEGGTEGGFGGQVIGNGAYVFWNNLLYVELSGYEIMPRGVQQALGEGISQSTINGVAPYWRVALNPSWGNNNLMIGTFGMAADVVPNRISGFGNDHILDVGVDSQYQYTGDKNDFTLRISNIWEDQQLDSSFLQGAASNRHDTLDSFNVSGEWVYDHMIGLTAGYFNVSGSKDVNQYADDAAFPSPMFNGNPDGDGLVFDVAYSPFMHGGPKFWPWANVKIGVSYWRYLRMFGGTSNFDGNGHSASDNNTVLAYAWLMF